MDAQSGVARDDCAQDRQQNLRPLAVIATVGTTSTASIDPVPEIARDLPRRRSSGSTSTAPTVRGLPSCRNTTTITEGWSGADSIVVNPHKDHCCVRSISACFMCAIRERLRRVFTLVPEYLRGDTVEVQKNYMDYGIQLGRRPSCAQSMDDLSQFRPGRHGRASARMRAAGEPVRRLDQDRRSLRAGCAGESWASCAFVLSLAAARSRPCGAEFRKKMDKLNSEIVERINASGRAYLTQTKLRGRTVMRIGLGNVLTTERHLREAWEMIRETVP